MNIFLKSCAGVLVALILWLCLSKNNKDMAVLLTVTVCVTVLIAALSALQPVVAFVSEIQQIGDLDNTLITVILKTVGIGLISELCVLVCKDAGNESVGKVLQTVATAVILRMSIPVFEKLLTLLDDILGAV